MRTVNGCKINVISDLKCNNFTFLVGGIFRSVSECDYIRSKRLGMPEKKPPLKPLDDFEIKNHAVASPMEWSEVLLIVIGILVGFVVAFLVLKKIGFFESRCFLGIREILVQFKTDVTTQIGTGFIRFSDIMMRFQFRTGRSNGSEPGTNGQNGQTELKKPENR